MLLKKEGSNFLLFDNYDLELLPAYVTLTTHIADAKLFIGDEEVVTSDSDEFIYQHGAVIPGKHTFTAKAELDSQELITEETVTVTPVNGEQAVALDIQDMHFEVSSNIEDAMVYLNEENVGQLENDVGAFDPFVDLEYAILELR